MAKSKNRRRRFDREQRSDKAPPQMVALQGAARRREKAFPGLMGMARGGAEGLHGSESVWAGETRYPAAQASLYRSLREAVPIIDAAVMRLVRLVGGFSVHCENESVERRLRDTLEMISVGGTQRGMAAFVGSYFEQLLTFGTAIGELVLREDGEPAALWNVPLEGIALRRAKNGLDVEICTGEEGELRAAPHPELLCCSVLNPAPGALTGNSLLKGLPFVSGVLLQIMDTIGLNWERLGNVRFAVTYHPGNDPSEQARDGERFTTACLKALHPMVLGDMVIGVDAKSALEMVEAGGVITDHDRLIDRQFHRAGISTTVGFAKIFSEAVVVLQ